jgi:hypothetical protein
LDATARRDAHPQTVRHFLLPLSCWPYSSSRGLGRNKVAALYSPARSGGRAVIVISHRLPPPL